MIELTVIIMGAVFIALKLAEVIAWSWWIVLSPFWAYLLVVLFLHFVADLFKGSWD